MLKTFIQIVSTAINRFSCDSSLKLVVFLESCTDVYGLPIDKLLPRTIQYMTYGGSQTQPGCRETVTWIILNKPTYISQKQVT